MSTNTLSSPQRQSDHRAHHDIVSASTPDDPRQERPGAGMAFNDIGDIRRTKRLGGDPAPPSRAATRLYY